MTVEGPYIIEESIGSDEAELLLAVPHDLPYFNGHFPDVPVLPGVVQLAWVVKLARSVFGVSQGVVGIENLKFQHVVVPEQSLRLALSYVPDSRKLRFSYRTDRGPCSSGRILFDD